MPTALVETRGCSQTVFHDQIRPPLNVEAISACRTLRQLLLKRKCMVTGQKKAAQRWRQSVAPPLAAYSTMPMRREHSALSNAYPTPPALPTSTHLSRQPWIHTAMKWNCEIFLQPNRHHPTELASWSGQTYHQQYQCTRIAVQYCKSHSSPPSDSSLPKGDLMAEGTSSVFHPERQQAQCRELTVVIVETVRHVHNCWHPSLGGVPLPGCPGTSH